MERAELETEIAKHHAESFGWALVCTGFDRNEAEDVIQAAYLRILEGRARFAGRSSPRTWIFGVIRRVASERRRRRALRTLLAPRLWAAQPQAAAAPDPERALALSRESASLARALAALPARQREVVTLIFWHGLTIEEAAGVSGLRVGTARTHYARAKQRLRAEIGSGRTP
jgi:RNA polymerase sigma-70 factor (ECF subfamily)